MIIDCLSIRLVNTLVTIVLGLGLSLATAFSDAYAAEAEAWRLDISKAPFGMIDAQPISLYTLTNDNGVVIKVMSYGAAVTSIVTPDRHGNRSDIACGFDTLDGYFSEAYKANSPYFGCTVGRYASRIKDGRFSVDGKDYQLATNNAPNHLHGGIVGFDKLVWGEGGVEKADDYVALTLTLVSKDGDEAYPGTLEVSVEYRLDNDNALSIRYLAETDKTTPVSLTNHTYFNLNGFKDTVLDHVLQLSSDKYLEPDDTNVPVGQETSVAGTVCDFNQAKRIGGAFGELPMGFEHYYVFSKPVGTLAKVAQVDEPTTGRTLEVFSSEPGTLVYTGRYTSDDLRRESGDQYGQFRGFCIETSKYPNGPNIAGSPSSVLKPGEVYDDTTIYKMSW